MKLRKLEEKDAPYMLEWMHDEKVNCYFRFNPRSITLQSTLEFIKESNNDKDSYHFAIVDENDEYLGTVSLKNIDKNSLNGEYAIALRSKRQGKGTGLFATEEILAYAFNILELERVYLNVLTENKHAIHFYEKIGFKYEGEFYNHIRINNDLKSIKWYRMMRFEYYDRKK